MHARSAVPLAAALSLAAGGCNNFYTYTPVTLRVVDAATRQPVPDAHVALWYPTAADFLGLRPKGSTGQTDIRGEVTLQRSETDHGYDVSVFKEGFAPSHTPGHALRQQAAAGEIMPLIKIAKRLDPPADSPR